MNEYPILFSTSMVQAIVQGRKTQTRRLVKRKALKWIDTLSSQFVADPDNNLCPFGKEGDLLWVRESFKEVKLPFGKKSFIIFKSDFDFTSHGTHWLKDQGTGLEIEVKEKGWKPSIHLKKEHARIWLRNEGYRIERLNDISKEDAIAEGIEPIGKLGYRNYMTPPDMVGVVNPTNSFQSLWQSIHGPDSWNENPWVWAVSFKVVATNGKP